MNKRTAVLLGLMLSCSGMKAQVVPLDSVLNAVNKNNPGLKQMDAMIKAQESYATGARSWEAPKLGAGLYMTPYLPYEGMGSVMLSADQMIPNPVKLKKKEAYMLGIPQVTKAQKSNSFNDLKAEAKMNYYELAIHYRQIAVLEESQEILNHVLKVAQIRYSYQKESLSNIYKAQARLAELENMELMHHNNIHQENIILNTIMNKPKDASFMPDTTMRLSLFDFQAPDTATLLKNRSDIKALQASEKVADLQQNWQKSQRLPDFGIGYSHMNTFSGPNLFNLMGTVTIPLAPWSSREYKSNIQGLEYEKQSYRSQQEEILNMTFGNIASLQTEANIKRQQLEKYDSTIIPSLENSYRTAMLAYEQNTGDLFEVLDLWKELQMARLERLDLVADLLNLKVSYEKELEL